MTLGEAQQFVAALNRYAARPYRLPTDTEWEYAAKGGQPGTAGDRYQPFAGSGDYRLTSWFSDDSQGRPHPTGTLQPNALQLYDMCGNAEEWTASTGNRIYQGKTYTGVYVRGGSYLDAKAERSVTFRRAARHPEQPVRGVGFRLAQDSE